MRDDRAADGGYPARFARRKYSTQECVQARQSALSYDENVGERIGMGLVLGLFLGPFGLPLAAMADANQNEKRQAVLSELQRHCEGDIPAGEADRPTAALAQSRKQLELLLDSKAKGILTAQEFDAKRRALVEEALAAPVAAPPSLALRVGDRLTMREFETVSRAVTSESVLALTAIDEAKVEFNGGALVIDHAGRALSGQKQGCSLIGTDLRTMTAGNRWTAELSSADPTSPPVRVRLYLDRYEVLVVEGRRIEVGRIALSGNAPASTVGLLPGHANALIRGEVLIEKSTGLLVRADVTSNNTFYAFRRDVVGLSSARQ